MLVSGVRSSCEASARKRRSLSSVAARSANATSMRLSIVFRLRPSRPTSVRGSAGCTRSERSPAEIASAVTAILSSGRRSRLIRNQAAAASAPEHHQRDDHLDGQQLVQRLLRLGERDADDEEQAAGAILLLEHLEAGSAGGGVGVEDRHIALRDGGERLGSTGVGWSSVVVRERLRADDRARAVA